MWLELQRVPSLKRCPLFSVLNGGVPLYRTVYGIYTFLWCCAYRLQRRVLPTDVFGVKVCDGGSEEPSHSIPELASDTDGGTTCGAEGIKGQICTTE